MKVQAQVSIYPLKTESLSLPVDEFCRILRSNSLEVRTEAMSSFITGKSEVIFRSVRQAFEALAHKHDLVMDFKVSSSCPENIANNDLTKEQR